MGSHLAVELGELGQCEGEDKNIDFVLVSPAENDSLVESQV